MAKDSSQTKTNRNSEPQQSPAPQESPENQSVEELAGRLSEVEGINDDTAQFLAENWQRFVGILVLAVLAVWLIGQFRSAVETKAGEASSKFSEIQGKFSALDAKVPAAIEETTSEETSSEETTEAIQEKASNKTAVVDSAFVLEKNYSSSSYAKFAPLYLAKLKINENKFAEARIELEALGALKALGQAITPAKLNDTILKSELASLLYGKSFLLEADSEADEAKKAELINQAKTHMTKLASNASVVQAEAVISILRTAKNNSEKQNATSLAEAVLERTPDLRDTLSREFSRLGINLDS